MKRYVCFLLILIAIVMAGCDNEKNNKLPDAIATSTEENQSFESDISEQLNKKNDCIFNGGFCRFAIQTCNDNGVNLYQEHSSWKCGFPGGKVDEDRICCVIREIESNTEAQETYSVFTPSSINEPTYIGEFKSYDDDSTIKFYFSLKDEEKNYISSDGKATVRILSEDGDELFREKYNISKEKFGEFTRTLTGESLIAYELTVPKSKILKSYDYTGRAFIKFSTDESYFDELESIVFGLPEYTEDEIENMQLSYYDANKIVVEETIREENLEVTLHSVGWFKVKDYSGDETYYRADFTVVNNGREESRLSTYDSYLINNRKQYERSYLSELDAYELQSGIERDGYILFENVPQDLNGKVIISAGSTYDDDYDEVDFKFTIFIE